MCLEGQWEASEKTALNGADRQTHRQTYRQTDKQTDGHGDSQTNSAKWGGNGENKLYKEI